MAKKKNNDIVIENRNKATPRQITVDVIVYIVLVLLVIIWLFPVVWVILNSFRGSIPSGGTEVGPATGSYFTSLFPEHWTTQNYSELFEPAQMDIFNVPRMFLNTLFIAIFTCLISTVFVISVSYSMSRRRFKMRQPLIKMSMIIGLFPGFMAIIAVYQILKALGLLEGNWIYLAMILIYSAGSGAGFILLKGYMDSIPYALDEAAIIDGATQWQVFTKIIIPISKPMIIYTILNSFLGPWLDFITANVITGTKSDYWTMSVGMYKMLDKAYINYWFANFLACAVLVTIPIGGLTIYMQKYYSESVSGAVKG